MKFFKMFLGLIILMCLNIAFAQTPIAHYTFDVDASDATGNYNGTLQGDAAIVDDAERGKVLGLTSTGYVSVPPAVTATMESFSFTAWVLFFGTNPWAGIMGMGVGDGGDAPYYDFHLRSSGVMSFYSSADPAAVWPGSGDCMKIPDDGYSLLDESGWVHLAYTFERDSGNAVYANADLKELEVWNAGYPNDHGVSPQDVEWEHVYIGKDYFNQQILTSTKIDEFMFFDTALTAEEVNAIYTGATAIENNSLTAPSQFELAQNYPNPFNPTTNINYSLRNNTRVELNVYDILGHHVATLVNGYQRAGTYSIVWNASKVSSGVYFYTMKTDNFAATKKMLLIE